MKTWSHINSTGHMEGAKFGLGDGVIIVLSSLTSNGMDFKTFRAADMVSWQSACLASVRTSV